MLRHFHVVASINEAKDEKMERGERGKTAFEKLFFPETFKYIVAEHYFVRDAWLSMRGGGGQNVFATAQNLQDCENNLLRARGFTPLHLSLGFSRLLLFFVAASPLRGRVRLNCAA